MLFHSKNFPNQFFQYTKGPVADQISLKMTFCVTNISAEILIHVLGYGICAKQQILMYFHLALLPLKA
jgi:hypothetical protein